MRMRPLLLVLGLAAAPAALGCGGPARAIVAANVPLAPPGVYVSDDVGAGFAAYKDLLTRWGEWSADASYGVHWCPRPGAAFPANTPFQPYRARGHWGADETRPVFQAAAGSPYWVSDDNETWGEVTMHHGWWVQLPEASGQIAATSEWCWVPGAEETPARVVWRTGEGFVGWAPEPPSWIDDGGEGVYGGFEWTFVLVGALMEAVLDDQRLDGDAKTMAASVTARTPAAASATHGFARVGPPAKDVRDARRALESYVLAHPEVRAATGAAARTNEANRIAAAQGASSAASASSSAPSTSTSSSTTTKKPKKSETDDEALPRGMVLFPGLARDPIGRASWQPSSGAPSGAGAWHGSYGSTSGGSSSASTSSSTPVTSHTSSSSSSPSHSSSSHSSSSHSSSTSSHSSSTSTHARH